MSQDISRLYTKERNVVKKKKPSDQKTAGSPAVGFSTVYRAELDWVMARRSDLRSRGKLPQEEGDVEQTLAEVTNQSELQELALETDLCGLALSGGGIRSATFALGVLQGLAVAGLLPRFDYLSTVSGGGYIGSWLSAWIRRAGFERVELELQPPRYRVESTKGVVATESDSASAIDAPPLRHVRQYSNFLAPQPGVFSFDGWVLLAIYLRNLLLNQCVLLLAALGLFVGVRSVVELFTSCYAIWFQGSHTSAYAFAVLTLTALMAAAVGTGVESAKGWSSGSRMQPSLTRFWSFAVIPWLVAALLSSLLALTPLARSWYSHDAFLVVMTLGGAVFHAWLGFQVMSAPKEGGFYGLLAGGVAGLLIGLGFSAIISEVDGSPVVAPVSVLGVPLCLSVFVLANFLQTGLCGSRISELEREWWSSLNSRMLMCASGWLVVFGMSIYGPWLIGRAIFDDSGGSWVIDRQLTAILGTGWAGAMLSGLWAARSAESGSGNRKVIELVAHFAPAAFLISLFLAVATVTTWMTYDAYAWMQRAEGGRFHMRAANMLDDLDDPKPVNLFAFGERAFQNATVWISHRGEATMPQDPNSETTAIPTDGLVEGVVTSSPKSSAQSTDAISPPADDERSRYPILTVLTLTAATSALLLGLSRWLGGRIGVNTFSLQNVYANRLVRCYLGASRSAHSRNPHPIVNLDPADNIALSQLFPGPDSRKEKCSSDYWGPLHIINAALNRKAGHSSKQDAAARAERLMFLDRKAESFVFTPLYCGSNSTKYCPSWEFADDIKVGTAVAVSGAAVSPNMGYHSSASVTALLTLFNIRMGAWFGNPSDRNHRGNANPPASWWMLLKELAGATDADEQAIYVSDGGHFENVGVYELIRRRCRFILAIEAGADPTLHGNVGRIVRQARMDFGVRIELDTDLISPDPQGISQQHLMVGRIHYGDVHMPAEEQAVGDPTLSYANNQGVIVWIKNSVTGDESGDLKNHRAMHPKFPYDSTVDQFFDESQFESYRELGLHSIQTLLTKARPAIETHDCSLHELSCSFATPADDSKPPRLHELPTRDLFKILFESWSSDIDPA